MAKKILNGLGALALVIGAGAAWAHGPGRHLMMKQMIYKRVAEAEDLIQATPDQRAQIEKSKDAIVTALQQSAQARRQEHQDLGTLLTSPTLAEAKVQSIADAPVGEAHAIAL